MPSCYKEYYPLCVKCGQLQPKIEHGGISRHNCDGCGKAIEVYRDDNGMYHVACMVHSMRQMNGALVCTMCGYERERGP
jgi:hypothetical protein